jgi:hypothetical protein
MLGSPDGELVAAGGRLSDRRLAHRGQTGRSGDSQILSFADLRARYPNGDVLSRNTGFERPYGQNPYEGYDTAPSSPPFDYGGRLDPRLPPVERVLTSPDARAISGPLRGAQLHRLHDLSAFWFAVAAFLSKARLATVGSEG